jgi:carbonic anhydrase
VRTISRENNIFLKKFFIGPFFISDFYISCLRYLTFRLLPFAFCLIFTVSLAFADAQKCDEALARLLDGNKRFVSEHRVPKDNALHPYAVVVTCSEPKATPEIIFDQSLGDIFVIRAAGNVLDAISVGSIEFAVKQLHIPLVIMLGHDKCDMVSAALEAKGKSEDNMWTILRKILPAVKKASAAGGTREDIYKNAVRENVLLQYKYLLRKSPVVKNLISSGELKVVTGIYHDDSGIVELFSAQ